MYSTLYSKKIIDAIFKLKKGQATKIKYRGIYIIIVRDDYNKAVPNYKSSIQTVSKFIKDFDWGNSDTFVSDDTVHIWNDEQTTEEKIQYLLNKAIRDINKILDDGVNRRNREIKQLEKEIRVIDAWNSNNESDMMELV